MIKIKDKMARDLENTVEIAKSCYYNMLRTIGEIPKHEQTGFVYGRKYRDHYILFSSYGLKTSKRFPKSVYAKNQKAIQRLIELDNATRNQNGPGTRIRGGFHDHIHQADKKVELMRVLDSSDIDYIGEEMKTVELNQWIEVLLNLREIKYKREIDKGQVFLNYKNKMRAIVRTVPKKGPCKGYHIYISAYKIEKNPKLQVKELKVRMPEIEVRRKPKV